MAVVKYSAIVTSITGKLNGTVFAKNRAGAYMRTKVTPSNPRSTAQMAVRASFAFASQSWRALTEPERIGWTSLAQEVSARNAFGDAVILTGSQLFVKLNANLQGVGNAIITAPPALTPATSLLSLSLTAAAGTPAMTLAFGPSPVPADHKMWYAITPQLSPSTTFTKNKFRKLGVAAAAATTPINILSAYTSVYGALLAGQRIACKAYLVNTVTGFASIPLTAEILVAA